MKSEKILIGTRLLVSFGLAALVTVAVASASTHGKPGGLSDVEKPALVQINAGSGTYLAGMGKAVEMKDFGAPINELVSDGKRTILGATARIRQTVAAVDLGALGAHRDMKSRDGTVTLLMGLKDMDMNGSLFRIVHEARVGTEAVTTVSRKIVDAIGVIDSMISRTNIPALNAVVEAAHASEHRRGFAAMASEMRNLAQRSASAAKEINILIGDSFKKVSAGSRLADQPA